MPLFDIFAVIVVGLSALFGFIKGFAHQLIKVAALVGAVVVIYKWHAEIAKFLIDLGIPAQVATYVVIPAVLFGAFAIASVFTHLTREILKKTHFGPMNRVLGLALGAAKGAILCAGLLYVLVQFPSSAVKEAFVTHRVLHNSWAAEQLVVVMGNFSPLLVPRAFIADTEEMMEFEPREIFYYSPEEFWGSYAALGDDAERGRFLSEREGRRLMTEMQVDSVKKSGDLISLTGGYLYNRADFSIRADLIASYPVKIEQEEFHRGQKVFVIGRVEDFTISSDGVRKCVIRLDAEEVKHVQTP